MKKLCSIILCLVLCLCCFSALADDSSGVEFKPTLTTAADQTPTEWMTNSQTRALLTLVLSLDYSLATDGDPRALKPDISEPSYVGRASLALVVTLTASDNRGSILILYDWVNDSATYWEFEYANSSLMKTIIESTCSDGYYENSLTDLLSVTNALRDALQ